jgi:predicted CoA-binding protein
MTYEEIFSKYKIIAVYGMSKHPTKPAHSVPAFMMKHGFHIIPINPTTDQILKQKSYTNLMEIPYNIDILNVFRPSPDTLSIIKEAIERKKEKGDIRLIWLQEGIVCPEGKALAEENGIQYIENRCMYKDYVMVGISE